MALWYIKIQVALYQRDCKTILWQSPWVGGRTEVVVSFKKGFSAEAIILWRFWERNEVWTEMDTFLYKWEKIKTENEML